MNYDNILDFCEEYAPAQTPTNGLDLTDDDMEEGVEDSASNTQTTEKPKTKAGGKKTPVIDNFSIDLTQAAAEGKLDPCVGREKEIQRLTEILGRRKKNNPILIGEPGVGKSAIVEGLAQRIADISRTVRGAYQGSYQGVRGKSGYHCLHRRDTHNHRCRWWWRHYGCSQYAQACIGSWQGTMYWCYYSR